MSFYRLNNDYRIFDATGTVDKLEPGNYLINEDNKGIYMSKYENFKIPSKLYGNTQKMNDRILNTFNSRKNSLGVLLAGKKGSGKSLLSKTVCANSNLPVIIINKGLFGLEFNNFISHIKQECVLFFDEFEKIYSDTSSQEKLLTILDGVFQEKRLFIFTCNNQYKIDQNMINRPGRIYYTLNYNKLSEDILYDYINSNLKNSSFQKEFKIVYEAIDDFNFDMLQAMVEECNRYNESPIELMEIMNIKPSDSYNKKYSMVVYDKNTNQELFKEEKFLSINNYNFGMYVDINTYSDEEDEYGDNIREGEYIPEFYISHVNLKESSLNSFVYEAQDYRVIFTKV